MRAGAVIVAMTCAATLHGCAGKDSLTPGTDSLKSAPAAVDPMATAVIAADGDTVAQQADGVLVTATALGRVAASGTVLEISTQATSVDPVEAQVGSSGPMRLILGSGEQPQKPITLQFDVSGRPDLAEAVSDTVLVSASRVSMPCLPVVAM